MSNIVLLDTGIVGGLLSEVNNSNEDWGNFIDEMVFVVKNGKYTVPTPVWYEIAQWHKNVYKNVVEKIKNNGSGIYRYAGYSIPNDILMSAAWYKCNARLNQGNPDTQGVKIKKDRISMVDALIASYCLKYDYYVLTLNIQDFPEKFFKIVKIEQSPSSTNYQRDFAALLKPKKIFWNKIQKYNI